MSEEGNIQIWYTTVYNPKSKKWLSIESTMQVVGEFNSKAEAEADGDGRLR